MRWLLLTSSLFLYLNKEIEIIQKSVSINGKIILKHYFFLIRRYRIFMILFSSEDRYKILQWHKGR